MDARSLAEKHLSVMEILIGREIPGETVGHRFENLYGLCTDRFLAQKVDLYGEMLNKDFCGDLDRRTVENDAKGLIALSFISDFFRSVAHRYQMGSTPKSHHWLPVCYLKGVIGGDYKRKGTIPSAFCQNGSIFSGTISDSSFTHPRVDGEGFYHLAVEKMFSFVESRYSSSLEGKKIEDRHCDVIRALLFFAQIVRSPMGGKNFLNPSIHSVFDEILENIDRLKAVHLKSTSVRRSIPVTPYVPLYVRFGVKTGLQSLLPIRPREALVISEAVMSDQAAREFINFATKKVIIKAMKTNSVLIGIQKEAVKSYLA